MPTGNAFPGLKKYPIVLVCLAFVLAGCGGSGGSDDNETDTAIDTTEFDVATRMPKDQTVVISEAILAEELTNAFQLALNSPGDNIALSIEGKVKVPLPIPPPVPPGSIFAGVDVKKTMKVKFVEEDATIYYEVSFEKDLGLNVGLKVPALPKDNEVSAGVTNSFGTTEVFRFDTPIDATRGIMDYFLLQGVWRSMSTLNNFGIDGGDVAGFVTDFTSHVTSVTGLNFGLTAGQLNKLLEAELLLLNFRQAQVDAAQTVLSADLLLLRFLEVEVENAQNKLNEEQRVVDRWQARFNRRNCDDISFANRNVAVCAGIITALAEAKSALFLANAALNLALLDLSIQQAIVVKAQDKLDLATAALDLVQKNIIAYQNSLSALPPDELVISFDDVVEQITIALEFLVQNHVATELKISKALSSVAKADALGGVNAKRTQSVSIKLNNDDTIAVAIKTTAERAVEVRLAIDATDKGEVKKTNEIEYELGLVKDSGRYKLEDKGTFKIESDTSF